MQDFLWLFGETIFIFQSNIFIHSVFFYKEKSFYLNNSKYTIIYNFLWFIIL